MNLSPHMISASVLSLSVSFHSIVQAESSLLLEDDTNVSARLSKSLNYTENQDLFASALLVNHPLKDERGSLDSPMVTKNISFKEVRRASEMAAVAYRQVKPSAEEKAQELIRQGVKIHNFGENSAQIGCVIEDTNGDIYVAFRGTVTQEDWKANLDGINFSTLSPNYLLGKVGSQYQGLEDAAGNAALFHPGFFKRVTEVTEEYSSVLKNIAAERGIALKHANIKFVGHSQGAALATIATKTLAKLLNLRNLKLITLASPRAMNTGGVKGFKELINPDNVLMVRQTSDVVTGVSPKKLNYEDASDNFLYVPMHLTSDDSLGMGAKIKHNFLKNHHVLDSYEKGFNALEQMHSQGHDSMTDAYGDEYTLKVQGSRGNPVYRFINRRLIDLGNGLNSIATKIASSIPQPVKNLAFMAADSLKENIVQPLKSAITTLGSAFKEGASATANIASKVGRQMWHKLAFWK